MKVATVATLLLVALGACNVPQPEAPIKVAINVPVTRFTLPNGLEVIVQEDHRTPHVAVNLRYHAGSKNDPPGRAGLAHLVEHLQFAESEHTARDSFFRTINQLGAEQVNGSTGADGTWYYETVPTSSLESVLWIEADRMASARLGWSADAIVREKNIVAQELRLRYRNQPAGFRWQLLTYGVYPVGHPYRKTFDEETEERASTSDELRAFAEKYYGPDDATLMLVGDVNAEHAKEIVAKYFGAIAPCAAHVETAVPPVEHAAFKRLEVIADVDEPIVYVAWPLPAPAEDGFYESTYALSNVEGGVSYQTTDEHKTMRPRSVGWGTDPGRLGSLGYISATPVKGASAEDLIDAIDITRTRYSSHDWSRLASIRSNYIAEELRAVEALGERAERMQEYLDQHGEADYVMKDLKAMQAVTIPRVTAAVDTMLDLRRAVVVVVTPDHTAPRAGKIVKEVAR